MSNSGSIKYTPLAQSTPSDEDDDEDEGFDDNILYDSRLVKLPSMERRNVFELERLGQPRVSSEPGVQYMGKGRRTCVLVTMLLVILLGALAAVVFPLLNHALNHGVVIDTHSGKSSQDWTRTFNSSWTESCVRMLDVDGDGLDDIVIGLADVDCVQSVMGDPNGGSSIKDFCKSKGVSYPCVGQLAAYQGYSGQEIWNTATRSVVAGINCVDVDIDQNGVIDCVVTGRHSTCQALDVRTGKTLWTVDPEAAAWTSHFVPDWSVHQVVSVPDLDGDNVLDLIVSHSPDFNSQDTKAGQGRLVLLSGISGLPIGNSFFDLPSNQVTYSPAVKYIWGQGAVYILIGTASDTQTAGSLLAVSLIDLYQTVTGETLTTLDSRSYTWLAHQDTAEDGVARLYSDDDSGVMSPPVLADVDGDEVTDILVTTRHGTLTLLDGASLTTKWTRQFTHMETHSPPTPGYFNTDQILDFAVHLNIGSWDKYNSSQTVIVSGVDGTTLWETQTGDSYSYSSDLSLRTTQENLSVFLIKLAGLNTTEPNLQAQFGLDPPVSGPGSSSFLPSFSEEKFYNTCIEVRDQVASDHVTCDRHLDSLTQEVVLLDRFSPMRAVRVVEQPAVRLHYRLYHQSGQRHCNPLSDRHKDKIDMCAVMVPTGYTGAVGDVDDDGSLDYIHMTQMLGVNHSDTFVNTGPLATVILSKHSINAAIKRGELTRLDLSANRVTQSSPPVSSVLTHFSSLQLLPSSLQAWTQYLGSRASGWYYTPP